MKVYEEVYWPLWAGMGTSLMRYLIHNVLSAGTVRLIEPSASVAPTVNVVLAGVVPVPYKRRMLSSMSIEPPHAQVKESCVNWIVT